MSHLKYPAEGQKITVENNQLVIPDNPIIGYVKGDGIGPDVVTTVIFYLMKPCKPSKTCTFRLKAL